MTQQINTRRLVLLVAVLAAISTSLLRGQQRSAADSAYFLLDTRPDDAAKLFRQALAADPTNVALHRQLGYLYMSRDDQDGALEQFELADYYGPSDTIKLQRAYLLTSLGRTDDAKILLRQLGDSPLPELRETASRELAALPAGPEPSRHWYHVYGATYYDTRWKALFYQGHVQRGYDMTRDGRWSVYAKASVSGDNKSQGVGLAPLVISDNSFLLAAGVRYRPLPGLMIDVQEGLAFDLIDKGSGRTSRGDFRAVANYGAGIYAPFMVHDSVAFPMAPFADVYASAGYYSRYKNGICYAQARAGLHAMEVSRTSVDVYARLDLVGDTERLFYNNLVEMGGGVRLTPNVDWGLYLIGEYHRGFYLDVSASATQERSLLYGAAYNSVRFFIIFDRMF